MEFHVDPKRTRFIKKRKRIGWWCPKCKEFMEKKWQKKGGVWGCFCFGIEISEAQKKWLPVFVEV